MTFQIITGSVNQRGERLRLLIRVGPAACRVVVGHATSWAPRSTADATMHDWPRIVAIGGSLWVRHQKMGLLKSHGSVRIAKTIDEAGKIFPRGLR
jgi:hypothetical protein